MRLIAAAIVLLWALTAWAHPASVPSARLRMDAHRGYRLVVRFDLLAYALERSPNDVADSAMNDLLDGPVEDFQARLDDALARFIAETKIVVDGREQTLTGATLPPADAVRRMARPDGELRLPVMIEIEVHGVFEASATRVAARFSRGLGTVVMTVEAPYREPRTDPVEPGQVSAAVAIPTERSIGAERRKVEGVFAKPSPVTPPTKPAAQQPDRKVEPPVVAPTVTPPAPVEIDAPRPNPWPGFVRLGFLHIVPNGLDHILFVVGLFLLCDRVRDLVKWVTAFTVAHSLTLALGLYGVARLPASVVEPLIAASMPFVAVENLFARQNRPWRIAVVFGFGLIHGLGFAAGLRELGLARADFVTALVGFNVGVELGQLSVVALAFLAVGWWRGHERYRSYVLIPASASIAMVAAFWTVQRALGG